MFCLVKEVVEFRVARARVAGQEGDALLVGGSRAHGVCVVAGLCESRSGGGSMEMVCMRRTGTSMTAGSRGGRNIEDSGTSSNYGW